MDGCFKGCSSGSLETVVERTETRMPEFPIATPPPVFQQFFGLLVDGAWAHALVVVIGLTAGSFTGMCACGCQKANRSCGADRAARNASKRSRSGATFHCSVMQFSEAAAGPAKSGSTGATR